MSSKMHVYLACDERYVVPAAVTIASIEANTKSEVEYRVMSHGLSEDAADALAKVANVRIVEVGDAFGTIDTRNMARIASTTYYRLLIPKIAESDRCLYTDADVVFNEDIAEIYDVDLEGKLMGAVRDLHGYSLYESKKSVRGYWDNVVKADPESYFCAGFLIMDLKSLRLADLPFEEVACSYPWAFHDMDVLNHLLKGKVKLLEQRWVVMPPDEQTMRYLPKDEARQQKQALENPAVFHYAGDEKPWNKPVMWNGDKWWSVAETLPRPLYQEAIAMLARASAKAILANYDSQIASLQSAMEEIEEQHLV